MIAATLPALLLAAGCGTSDSGQESAPEATETEESTPHGYIEGAEEAAEPQSRLVLADAGTGGIHVLDLITEEITEAGEFHHRAGSTTLAALAADGSGFWLLDVTTGDWQFTADDTVTAVNAVGSGGAVLTLTDTGELVSRDGTDGTETARVPLTGDRIEVDSSRAYISDPEGQQVVEIDYADGLRTARTFDLGFTPSYMVETGR